MRLFTRRIPASVAGELEALRTAHAEAEASLFKANAAAVTLGNQLTRRDTRILELKKTIAALSGDRVAARLAEAETTITGYERYVGELSGRLSEAQRQVRALSGQPLTGDQRRASDEVRSLKADNARLRTNLAALEQVRLDLEAESTRREIMGAPVRMGGRR